MRVLRTVTIANSAATKKPLREHQREDADETPQDRCERVYSMGVRYALAVGEEVGVDEVVDDRLVGRLQRLELNPHADASIAPGDAPLGVDVLLAAGNPEPHADLRSGFERAGRPDRHAAVTQVQRQRRGDGVAEPVLHRNAERRPAGCRAG